MGLREKLRRNRKNHRLIGGGLVALLLLFTGLFYLAQRGRDLPSALVTNRVLLFVLWYVNVLLTLIILFVLLRNLVKLLIERRHRVLGSTFKSKLVATYIGLSLIPVLLLFAIATELLRGSMDRWFNTPVAPVLERGNAVAQALYDQIQRTNLRDAGRALREIRGIDLDDPQQRPRLDRRLTALLDELDLDALEVFEGQDFVSGLIDSQSGLPGPPDVDRSFLEQAAQEGKATAVLTPTGTRGASWWPPWPCRTTPPARRRPSWWWARSSIPGSPPSARSWWRTTRPTASSWRRRTTSGPATSCSS